MQQKIVITGGPGTGKTSIITELEKQNYFCYPEVIREITLKAKKKGNLEDLSTNPIAKVNDPLSFNIKILNGRINQYKDSISLKDNIIFFDRGIPDILGYMDYFNQSYDNMFKQACKDNIYTKVFVLPPWQEIYIYDNERFETYEEAVQIHFSIEKVYEQFDYTLVKVPFGTINERVNFILENI